MTYARWEIDVYIDFAEYLQLFEGFSPRSASGNYSARLTYNYKKSSYLQLSIFYENRHYLEERFIYLQEHDVDILSLIKKKHVNYIWERSDLLDLSKSRLIEIRDNPSGWEQGKRVVELIIDNVDILVDGGRVHDGLFHLTENAIIPTGEALSYSYRFSWDDWDGKLIDADNNIDTVFGDFNFKLKLEHSYGNSDKFNLNITRAAYLQVRALNEEKTDSDILFLANLLCLLMSFYLNKRIDFLKAHARIINNTSFRTREIFKYSNWTIDDSEDYLLKSKYPLFYDFINDIDYTKTISCQSLLEDIIPKIIQSKYVDDSSRYMLLYNVIEKIRNFCLSNEILGKERFSIKEEYSFTLSGNPLKKFIKEKIQAISECIAEEDKVEYIKSAGDKITFMKKTALKDQFDSLINYLGIDSEIYEIDFKSLIKVRNDLYHGAIANQNDIQKYNPILERIINDLIFSLLQ